VSAPVLSFTAPRLLPPSLAVLAALYVVVGALWVWPESWEASAPVSAPLGPSSAAPALLSAAPGAGDDLSQPLEVTPVFAGGVPKGLLLGAVREGSLFARMGLIEGDVLLSFHDLGELGAPQLVAHVERRGRPMRVEYSMAPAPSDAALVVAPASSSRLQSSPAAPDVAAPARGNQGP
jgi:hypothetical protein